MAAKKKDKINWKYYIIELMVVFIGVTAGFLLNTWRQDSADLKLQEKYLSSFYNNIISDASNLDSLIMNSNSKLDTLLDVINETEVKNVPLSEELAQTIVRQILYIEWISPSNDTYEDIVNSGNLNLISDYSLKEQISSYYKFLTEVKYVEEFYKDHLNNYALPVLYKNYHLYKQKFVNKKSYQSLEFTNMYLGVIALLQQSNSEYKKALMKNKQLQEKLTTVLKIKQ